jgi:hypothetical protein
MSEQHKQEMVSAGEMSYSNMLALNALVEMLDERGIIPKKDVLERIRASQASVQIRAPQSARQSLDTTHLDDLHPALPLNPTTRSTAKENA